MAARFRETATALKVVVIAVGVLQHLDPGKISFKFYLIIYDQYDQYDEAIAIMADSSEICIYNFFSKIYKYSKDVLKDILIVDNKRRCL